MDSKEGRRTLALSFAKGHNKWVYYWFQFDENSLKPLLAFFKKTGQTRRSVTDGIYSMAWNRSKATLDAAPAKEEGKDE
ncbi:hypothetical protein VNO78_24378 [Psophocarpus tetragonolobus]|uniref:Uncharacterized protein n=1 Tax=Psophocarpus tetragonolobus TaxID=3891 RepID=A0AAN9S528_PSOTE